MKKCPLQKPDSFIQFYKRWNRLVATLLFTLSLSACRDQPVTVADVDPRLLDTLNGALLFQRPDGIYRLELGKKEPDLLVRNATYPRWSPGGKRVACVRGNEIVVCDIATRATRTLTLAGKARAVAWAPDGDAVLFTDDRAVRRVALSGGTVTEVLSGPPFFELDCSPDGSHIVATIRRSGYRVMLFSLNGGTEAKVGSGCSASFSPDGSRVTINESGHRVLALYSVTSLQRAGSVHAPAGLKSDNQFWSNHPDWIASKSEGDNQDIYLHHVPSDRAAQATFSGDCDRPDLFVY